MNILHVEDYEGDINLVRDIIKGADPEHNIISLKSGQKALDYLEKLVKETEPSKTDLVLLDLGLPDLDGLEVLSYIKENESLRPIPVVILTGLPNKIENCTELGALACFVKPMEYSELVETVMEILLLVSPHR